MMIMRTDLKKAYLLLRLAVVMVWAGLPAGTSAEPALIVGPNKCGECHKNETSIWQKTHHFSTFRDLAKDKDAQDVASKMGVKRISAADSPCLDCHFTVQSPNNAIAGVSCESCHGAGKDWIQVHAEFSGKKEGQESKSEIAARWAKSEAAGMIRPKMTYTLAKNCFTCHVVPNEKLVNVGGHVAGSEFELVGWSQGEVRHNVWYNKGKSNPEASIEHQRMMFLVGRIAELEMALIGVSKATAKEDYGLKMAKRADNARKVIGMLVKLLPNTPELAEISEVANGAALKLNNAAELVAAAGKVSVLGLQFSNTYDGSAFGAIDKYLPRPNDYKGSVSK
jgi:hypothetical protein